MPISSYRIRFQTEEKAVPAIRAFASRHLFLVLRKEIYKMVAGEQNDAIE